MSDDEIFATIVCVALAVFAWAGWYAELALIRCWRTGPSHRTLLAVVPLLCAAGTLGVLTTVASGDVVNDRRYIFMYLVMGMAWVGIVVRFAAALGISFRGDAIERANPAARIAIAGLLAGTTACFAGGNIGNGPGWWVVVFCAALATGSLLAGWLVIEMLARISESITVERSWASGMRLAGFLVGAGLVLGRAVAGDWVSVDATMRDFAIVAWPVLPLLALVIVYEFLYRPTATKPEQSITWAGWYPMLIYIGFGVCHLLLHGLPVSAEMNGTGGPR